MTTWSIRLKDVFLLCHISLLPPNTHPGPVLKATLFIGHNHAPEKVSWPLQASSFPAEVEPALLNLFAKFMCPQMVLCTEKSDPQALKHLHCFKRMEEMSASNYHIYSSFFCPGENRRSSFLKTCKYFTFVWRADFFPGVWKAEVTDTWLLGDAVAECKHRLFLAQQNLPVRPCWGQERVNLM